MLSGWSNLGEFDECGKKQIPISNYDRVTVVKNVTHTKGWQERWEELLSLSLL
jgi:hypothetical protein